MKKIKSTKDITIYPDQRGLGPARVLRVACPRSAPHGMGIPVDQMDYLQADNEMNTFAKHDRRPRLLPAVSGRVRRKFSTASVRTSATSTPLPIIRRTPNWMGVIAS